ncbi:ABC transporter ATP-binding protein [Microvirga terricola]|uniref:ABC transporter ATP-binding protein n=1 Tax=Microvirga terricola TaxID=2719797 RepID=A0ABX0VBU9_9HYPH|nr:ABC transporter ATP-binding protein [Microvirga terricola]NIX75856.1 ABC transporter ATP-binding protein [Microvirga terricola]
MRSNRLESEPGPSRLASPLALEVDGLSVDFSSHEGNKRVVDGVSYAIARGQTLGVVGESGCGKSMTALALLGLVPKQGCVTGRISVSGQGLSEIAIDEWPEIRGKRIAMVFQEPMTALNPAMRIGDQIAEVLHLHEGLSWKEARERAVEELRLVGIPSPAERANAYPHQLSGGMRQRVVIAMALACRPDVLIADEPTTALDVTIQAQILELMQRLQDEIGMAVQFISHNLAVVSEIADDVIVMYAGQIVERASADELFSNPLHPYTQGLIATLPKIENRQDELPVIPGMVPRLDGTLKGCRFAGRCVKADSECHALIPVLRSISPGHDVACHKVRP